MNAAARMFAIMMLPATAALGAHGAFGVERQLTFGPHGHILTNTGVWSADGKWIVYDVRSDAEGTSFDGDRIERVNVWTGDVQVLYRAANGARCGVVTFHPTRDQVVFILGPENPTPDWRYGPAHRQGVIVDCARPGEAINLDARDLAEPFTPGALRGGSHVHVFRSDGRWVSFTYNDALVAPDERNVGVSVLGRSVKVGKGHARNHDGAGFSVLVTRTTAHPKAGSDEIRRAFEDAWVGLDGYVGADGSRQRRAIAFEGEVIGTNGKPFAEVFVVDLPDDLTLAGDGPLAGTAIRLPSPPKGCAQRRLTFTQDRKSPGVCAVPRHWLRSSPDGSRIAFIMNDDDGIAQLWTVSPNGGEPIQVTHNPTAIASAFSWSPDGRAIAHVMDGSVCVTDVVRGRTNRLTAGDGQNGPRPEACVFSPDGSKIAYVKRVDGFNQVFVVDYGPGR